MYILMYLLLINDHIELAGTRTEYVSWFRIVWQFLSWCCCQYDSPNEDKREGKRRCIRGYSLPSPSLWYTILSRL